MQTPRLRFKNFTDEWTSFEIADVVPKNEKYGIVDGPFGSNLKTIHYKSEGIPIVTSGYVTEGIFSAKEYLYVTEEKFEQEKRSSVKPGDIVMAKIGARCGASAILPKSHRIGILSGNALKITVDESRFAANLIWQQLWNLYQTGQINSLKTVGAQPAISLASLKKYKLTLPSLAEQQKIASFLSAVDEKIQQLTRKKELLEQYKKGVMQQLFSGKLRFKDERGKGYPKWGEKKLGELLEYIQPTRYLVESTEYDDSFSTPVLTAGKTFILGYTNENFGIYREKLPVIIFDDFTTAIQFVEFPFKAKSSAMKILVANKGENISFIYEAMQLIHFEVGGHGRHWISQYSQLSIPYPSREEQEKITTCLSVLDSKIESLTRQIALTQNFKKGLLQQMFV